MDQNPHPMVAWTTASPSWIMSRKAAAIRPRISEAPLCVRRHRLAWRTFPTLALTAHVQLRPSPGEPVDRDHRRDAGDVHGDPGHHGRQRFHSPPGGEPGRYGGRGYVGGDLVPGVERHRAAHGRVAGQPLRATPNSADLRRGLHAYLAALRNGDQPGLAY